MALMLINNGKQLNFSNRVIGIISVESFFQALSPTPLFGFKIQCRINFFYIEANPPKFYGDLEYKFKKIMGRTDFSDQFQKVIARHKCIGYNANVIRQSACLVINPT